MNKKVIVYQSTSGDVHHVFIADTGINAIVFAGAAKDTRMFVGTFGGKVRAPRVPAHLAHTRTTQSTIVNHASARLSSTSRREPPLHQCTPQVHCYNVDAKSEDPSFFFDAGACVFCLSLSGDARSIAIGGAAETTSVLSVDIDRGNSTSKGMGAKRQELSLPASGATLAAAFDHAGTTLVCGGDMRLVQVWRVAADCTAATLAAQFLCATTVYSIALTAPGDLLAVGTSDQAELYSLDLATKDPNGELSCDPLEQLAFPVHQGGVCFSQSLFERHRPRLAIAGAHVLTLYDVLSGATLRTFQRPGRLRCTALSADGNMLVAGSFDKKVTIDLVHRGSGATLDTFDGRGEIVRSVHAAADAPRLAIGAEHHGGGRATVYNTLTDEALFTWKHDKPVWCVRLSSGGDLLAAGGYGCALTLYDLKSITQIQQISYTSTIGPAFIWSLDFSSD